MDEDVLANMTLEEKVAQMFFITPEALTGADLVTEAGSWTETAFSEYPVGGLIYFEENMESREQLSAMLMRMQNISEEQIGIPVFLAADEEGGSVSRLYGGTITDIPYVGDMYSVWESGDKNEAYRGQDKSEAI